VEKGPEAQELAQARERARADARARVERDRTQPAADAPIVESAGPYEFAPEPLRDAYERAYEEALRELTGSRAWRRASTSAPRDPRSRRARG
jgi:hypothetical protein